MSRRTTVTKPRIRVSNKSVFHLQDKKADQNELTNGIIKSAKRTGQLSLCNRGLGTVPENVWKIDNLVLEDTKVVDFTRPDMTNWWNSEPLKCLDLSSNTISTISSDIKLLQALVTLKLHDNAITSLPAEIGELTNLSNLSLDRNKLRELPNEFYKLTELRWLGLSYNSLKTIDCGFGDLVMLNFLDLSHNELTALPPGMGYLVRLVELNLSHNKLQELPPDIVNLRDLKKLDISNNDLRLLPALGELRQMQYMDANHNNIEILPDFYGCTALKEIYLSNNYIKEITEEFCDQMQQLNVLNIRDNKLEIIPENISLLKKLKRLDLTNNSLNKLPKNLGLLTQLNSISMEGNKLSFVRQDVLSGGTDRMMKFLRDRISDDLIGETNDRCKAFEWPDKYTLKKNLAVMLPGRDLTEVPEEVFKTAAEVDVYIIDLSKNKFTTIPLGVVNLKETLTQLIISSNSIEKIPPEISSCVQLQYLDLGKNLLSDLPTEVGYMKNLRELVISNNRFTKIPRCVYELENLEIFLAADNKVEEINVSSDALARLKKLAVLDLTNNSICSVPPELGNFTYLRTLEIMGNSFRHPRHAILAKGTDSILSYLRDRIPTKYVVNLKETLTQLIISSNSIEKIPPEISSCVQLQYLDLGKNLLSDLPTEVGYMKNLRELVISNNRFTKIPRCVYELENLEIFLAADNKVEEINVSSDALARLKKLAVLDLTNNSICSVPPELGNFTYLRTLEIMGNSFRHPRHAILAKGTDSILSYLRDRIPTK